jgi:hypothetical protein
MATTLKEIGKGGEFHLRFNKTKIFKGRYGSKEVLIDEFDYNKNEDEFPAEIIWMPSIGRGLVTWFNFNKVERFEQHGILDYHKNLFLSKWKYSAKPEHDVVIASSSLYGYMFEVSIIKQKGKYYVNILISYENHYFRIEYSEPFDNSFKN